jgi:hypothetical protein
MGDDVAAIGQDQTGLVQRPGILDRTVDHQPAAAGRFQGTGVGDHVRARVDNERMRSSGVDNALVGQGDRGAHALSAMD